MRYEICDIKEEMLDCYTLQDYVMHVQTIRGKREALEHFDI